MKSNLSYKNKKRKKLENLLANSRKISDVKRRGKAVEAAKKRMEREVTRIEIDLYSETKVSDLEIKGHVHATKKY